MSSKHRNHAFDIVWAPPGFGKWSGRHLVITPLLGRFISHRERARLGSTVIWGRRSFGLVCSIYQAACVIIIQAQISTSHDYPRIGKRSCNTLRHSIQCQFQYLYWLFLDWFVDRFDRSPVKRDISCSCTETYFLAMCFHTCAVYCGMVNDEL